MEKINSKRTQRKRMAWVALASMDIMALLAMLAVKESRLSVLSEMMTWFFLGMTSIVGAYVGFSSFEDKINKRIKGDGDNSN